MICNKCKKEMSEEDKELFKNWQWCHPHVNRKPSCFECYCKEMKGQEIKDE